MSLLFYIVDPICSWCYTFSPTWTKFNDDLKMKNKLKVNSFPSLMLEYKNNYFPIKIECNNHKSLLNRIKSN
ncbi:MAG: protein-disulfide isomerase-like protein with CxxC motif [Arcobacteraceae bacterium]|jgi:protein-disulfide isomerase-like protein with CxxC motif